MVRYGNLARLTSNEVKEFQQIGLDLSHVLHQTDIEKAVTEWAYTLADERFDLLDKIAFEMANAKGVRLPPKFGAPQKGEQ